VAGLGSAGCGFTLAFSPRAELDGQEEERGSCRWFRRWMVSAHGGSGASRLAAGAYAGRPDMRS